MADSNFKDAVCIDAGRVYDSCCDRDCLEDLPCYFSGRDQINVNNSVNVRAKSAELLLADVSVEPVTFNRGYYSVDMIFYFIVNCDLYQYGSAFPTSATGLCTFNKKVILCGSDGNAKVFTSEDPNIENRFPIIPAGNYPKATVQTVDPIILSSSIVPVCDGMNTCNNSNIPVPVATAALGEPFVQLEDVTKQVNVSLGLFTVVQLVRNVQMLVPVYDFCVPEKECISNTDDPCELFKKIKFPVDEFFPPADVCNDCDSGCTACDE